MSKRHGEHNAPRQGAPARNTVNGELAAAARKRLADQESQRVNALAAQNRDLELFLLRLPTTVR